MVRKRIDDYDGYRDNMSEILSLSETLYAYGEERLDGVVDTEILVCLFDKLNAYVRDCLNAVHGASDVGRVRPVSDLAGLARYHDARDSAVDSSEVIDGEKDSGESVRGDFSRFLTLYHDTLPAVGVSGDNCE